MPPPPGAPENYDEKSTLLNTIFQSFRNDIKAYTALYNWLEIIDNEDYYETLLDKDYESFKRWLNLVASQGNVLGNK